MVKKMVTLLATCLLLTGCMSYKGETWGPWIEMTPEGPWCGPGERAAVGMMEYRIPWGFPLSGVKHEWSAYFEHPGFDRPHPVYGLCHDFSHNYLTRTHFWQQWPRANASTYHSGDDREIHHRTPPFHLYLVSIFPNVVVGVPKEKDGPMHPSTYRDPDSNYRKWLRDENPLFISLIYISESEEDIWMKTAFPAPPNAELVYFAPDLSMDLEALTFDKGAAFVRLPDGSQLTFARDATTVNVIREISP